jgi:hypothetical protein
MERVIVYVLFLMRAFYLTVRAVRAVAAVLTVLILKSLAVDGLIKRVTVNLSRTHLQINPNIKMKT